MKDIMKVYKDCKEKLDKLGIQTGEVVSVVPNSRVTSIWGRCTWRNGKFIIEIAQVLLEDDVNDSATESTMIHELLHTCKYCQNHGREWKQLAAKVNAVYGYNIKRADSALDKGVENIKRLNAKHKIVCKSCGNVTYRMRDSKLTENVNNYRCKCGGDLILEY